MDAIVLSSHFNALPNRELHLSSSCSHDSPMQLFPNMSSDVTVSSVAACHRLIAWIACQRRRLSIELNSLATSPMSNDANRRWPMKQGGEKTRIPNDAKARRPLEQREGLIFIVNAHKFTMAIFVNSHWYFSDLIIYVRKVLSGNCWELIPQAPKILL